MLAQDRQALHEIAKAWGPAHVAIQQQLRVIQSKIEDAEREGKPLGRSWLMQRNRAEQLSAQIERAISGYAPKAADIVARNQRAMVGRAQANSRDMAAVAVGRRGPQIMTSWHVLPSSAVEDLVGFAANGSPLRVLFDALGPQVSKAVRDQLSIGLALGRNPTVVARAVEKRSGMGLARAMTISRTESLRAYRETTRRSYDQSGVVEGWKWLSARQVTTCPACWAMDGQHFDTNDEMEAHPNCRCTMVPAVQGGVDIGSGAEVFDSLSAGAQRQILGPARHAAFMQGRIGLQDMVVRRRSRDWGTSVQVAPLAGGRR